MEGSLSTANNHLTAILAWVNANPEWAYGVVFLICLLESLAIVGVLVPGMVFLFSVGALVGTESLNFFQLCFFGALGAIIGDGLSYWLGYHYRYSLRTWPWFVKHQKWLQMGERFFHRYGASSIIIGRFFGPIRAFIPLVAGMFSMSPKVFYLANIFSALIWAPAVLLPGVITGAALTVSYSNPYALLTALALIILGLWFGYHAISDRRSTMSIMIACALLISGLLILITTQNLNELHDVLQRVWYVIQ